MLCTCVCLCERERERDRQPPRNPHEDRLVVDNIAVSLEGHSSVGLVGVDAWCGLVVWVGGKWVWVARVGQLAKRRPRDDDIEIHSSPPAPALYVMLCTYV